MIRIPGDYNTARAYDGTSAPVLPIGGHICRISGAEARLSRNGTEMLVVAFDIAEGGEFDGYYADRHQRAVEYNQNAKWPGVFRAPVTTREGKTSGYFKGLITAIEESNPGYKFLGDELTLKGKMVGFNFGEEEYEGNDGKIRTSVKPFYAVSVGKVREGIEPPRKKALEPKAQQPAFQEVPDDEDCPF